MSFLDDMTKKRRLEEVFNGPCTSENDDDNTISPSEYIGVDELTSIQHKECFACKYINNDTLSAEDGIFLSMMRLYTENHANNDSDGMYEQIKKFYDSEIKPVLAEDGIHMEWPLHVIKEHFRRHTRYPTDEILRQIETKQALRDHMNNHMIEKCPNGDIKYNLAVIKQISSLEKDIERLMLKKKELPSMIGYSDILKY